MKSTIKVSTTEKFLIVEKSGKSYSFSWKTISQRLAKATFSQKNNFQLSPSGYGIQWPDVNEDLSLPALLGNSIYNEKQLANTSINEPKEIYKKKKTGKK